MVAVDGLNTGSLTLSLTAAVSGIGHSSVRLACECGCSLTLNSFVSASVTCSHRPISCQTQQSGSITFGLIPSTPQLQSLHGQHDLRKLAVWFDTTSVSRLSLPASADCSVATGLDFSMVEYLDWSSGDSCITPISCMVCTGSSSQVAFRAPGRSVFQLPARTSW